jgi:DNA (cytosine-5)-methyltransferase 1
VLTVGSLFSGIGGLELGLEMTGGFQTVWQVEIDDYAGKVLKKHWPDVPLYKDVREVGGRNLEPVDLICGGFPCQPHSLAGARKAENDERDLWEEFHRIIRELRPRWVLAENVPGLLSSRLGGRPGGFFGKVLADLAEIGYDAEWDCIPASALGAHHQRDRVWILAYPTGRNGKGNEIHPGDELETLLNGQAGSPESGGERCSHVAHANSQRGNRSGARTEKDRDSESQDCRKDLAYPDRQGLAVGPCVFRDVGPQLQAVKRDSSAGGGIWATEPDVGRVAHGIPKRVDRLRGLGNAVVPQNAALIGRAIREAEAYFNQTGVMP